ncbi:MAG: zinc-binding dehydrogenase [Solirubrobacteraceae bacterium]
MHAIRQHEFGPPGVLRLEEVPDPGPGPGQVRIAVAAAGVHLLDTSIRAGRSGGPFPLPELPMTPGREVAGVVDAVGEGVDPAWLGRRAVAHLGQASGGYATRAVREADAVHEVPSALALPAAVAMIGTGRTALGVLEAAPPGPDDTVLILGAAGGLGSLLVQAAKDAGARVVGAAGGRSKVWHAGDLGADLAVDYDEPGWDEAVGPVTLLLDGVGGERGRAALGRVRDGGRVSVFGWSSGEPTELDEAALARRGITSHPVLGKRMFERPGGLRSLETAALARAAAGGWTPLLNAPYTLAEAAKAHAALERRGTVGKVVLYA